MSFFQKDIKTFIQVFVHDLKNKIGSIKFSLSLLKNPNIGEKEKEIIIDNTIATTDKTIDMLSDFLELEKYSKEKFLTNQKIILQNLLDEIINELYLDIKVKKISVKTIFPEKTAVIRANKNWLKKALLNIIHNSIKYNKTEGKIYIKIEPANSGFVLSIKDTGIGIDEIEKHKIFKKFHTTDKKSGTGIGLNMSKAVIESLGGKIVVESEKNTGTSFYIYLPKISKSIKIRKFATMMSAAVISGVFVYDYFYCLFPQKISKQQSENLVIYKFQNGITALFNKKDIIKITAKRNILSTKFKTVFKLYKSDILINTNYQPITVIANGIELKNLGTEFETINDKKILATSVYKGELKSDKMVIHENEGLIKKGDSLKKEHLPKKVSYINISKQPSGNVKINWISDYKNFKILISPSKKFYKKPVYSYLISSKSFVVDSIPDGLWYISIQSEKENLYSIAVIKKFIFLKTYLKALNAFKNNDINLAEILIDKSLQTINSASYKPYLLKSEILFLKKEYKKAFVFAKRAFEIEKNDKTTFNLAKIYYSLKEYKKSIKILKNFNQNIDTLKLLGKNYYKLSDYKNAKKYLFKVLEENHNDKEAIKILLKIFEKEKNYFMIKIFKNKLTEGSL